MTQVNLRGHRLSQINLRGVILANADLRDVDLSGSDLSGSDLSGVNLSSANLQEANLTDARLSGANLENANLTAADMTGATLSGATLDGAILIGSNGLTDEQLDSAESLSDVRLDTREVVLGALSQVCSGQPVEGAAHVGPGRRPIVVLDSAGDEHPWSSRMPDGWEPSAVRFAELVACIGEEQDQLIETCRYNGPDIERFRSEVTVRIVEARTGETFATQTVASDPRGCRFSEPWSLTRLDGSDGLFEVVQAWLSEFANTDTPPPQGLQVASNAGVAREA